MVELNNTSIYGLSESILASGYPMLSQIHSQDDYGDKLYDIEEALALKEINNNMKRATKLGSCIPSTGHDNFLKGIIVQTDIKYPQYFTPQLQRYSFLDIVSSMSKMHTLTKKENTAQSMNKYVATHIIDYINQLIIVYNNKDSSDYMQYEAFMKIVSNLPMGFEMTMRITTNYLQLKTIYNQRKNHKLKEDWGAFCAWILKLPHFKELVKV